MEQANPQPAGAFASVGGALFRRAAFLLGDETAAAEVTERLFVRFLVNAGGGALTPRARWCWVYRVVTNHCLGVLPDAARPLSPAADAETAGTPPATIVDDTTLGHLRAFDEATRNIAVLSAWDGLSPDEVAEVLGLPVKLVRRRLAACGPAWSRGGAPDSMRHPSAFALDSDRAAHAPHVAGCARCDLVVGEADRLMNRFARELAPLASARVATAVRAERVRLAARPRWRRMLWMGGAMVAVSALALLVARPRRPERSEAAYGGLKGASRLKASGLQITLRRAEEVQALKPGAALRAGDRLHFRVRAEHPRYLEVRVRRGGAPAGPVGGAGGVGVGVSTAVAAADDVRVFPSTGTTSVLVRPGQALDRDYVVDAVVGPGSSPARRLWVFALFADRPFPLDQAPGPDVEVVPVRVDVDP